MSATNPRRSPQFCPGLAAFTDAIEALPQETIRHFTLLREVDAKASGPEDLLRGFIKHALNPPPWPKAPDETEAEADPVRLSDDQPGDELSDEHAKRSRLHQVRVLISDLLLTLDEKIHVISTASEALAKHQVRLDDAYNATTLEIDPVIRDGNPAHWAYGNSIVDGSLNQRTGANESIPTTVYPTESELAIGSSRADGRREGTSRRYAHAPDQLEPKATNHTEPTGLHYENSPIIPAAKRRKGAAHSNQSNKIVAPERNTTQARSGTYSNSHTIPPVKAQTATKSHGPQNSVSNPKQSTSRKRAPAPQATATLSPTKQAFTDPRTAGGPPPPPENFIAAGPDPGKKDVSHRNPRSKPHSTKSETKAALKIDNHVKQEDKMSSFESKSAPASKAPQEKVQQQQSGHEKQVDLDKEVHGRKDHSITSQETPMAISRDAVRDGPGIAPLDGPLAGVEKLLQATEATEKTSSRGAGASAGKSAPKPLVASDAIKNAHPAVSKAIPSKPSKSTNESLIQNDDKSTLNDAREDYEEEDEDEDEGDVDADEMRYCYCNQISYGKMVACDGPGCQREWFHLPCVGLSHMPSSKDKWYCRECRTGIQNTPKPSKASQHRA
ncbi:hypothetical protein TWF730_004636 [Orbilia blumenaviensis]|uniref:Chromatin modification-related protein n=1 Tax=Orbilia blumenaviensis TaxID=1796055 RepID=A0AAV9TWT7_9PEZI